MNERMDYAFSNEHFEECSNGGFHGSFEKYVKVNLAIKVAKYHIYFYVFDWGSARSYLQEGRGGIRNPDLP